MQAVGARVQPKAAFGDYTGLKSNVQLSAAPVDFHGRVARQTSTSATGSKQVTVSAKKIRVAINGFGRIGRQFLRCWEGRAESNLEVVCVNDSGGVKQASHLLKYDSTMGTFAADVKITGEDTFSINGKEIKVVSSRDPTKLPWGAMNVDLVIEGTGVFIDTPGASKHIEAGAKKVLITAPAKGSEIPTYVIGVNADQYKHSDVIISNASCTTNCLAPFVKVLDEKFGIVKGTMTTTHSYTGDQRLLDASHRDLRRARAAALNIVPTTTGAAKAVALVLPQMKGKLNGVALRVPTPTVSVVDLVVQVEKKTFAEEVNEAFREAANGPMKGVLGVSDEPLVSCSDIPLRPDTARTRREGRTYLLCRGRCREMEAFKTLLWPFHAGLTTKEHDELERAAALAAAGREVPSALLHSVPSRTFQCNGAEFVRMRSLARCDRPTSVCCLPVLNPLGWVYRSWQALANCTDLTYTAFIVALSIAFNDPSGFTSGGWLDYADMLGSIVYIIDIILGFHVGIVAHWDTRAVVVCGGRAVASFYVRRGTFCLDLIASLPALAQLAVRLTEKRSQPLRLLYLIRLLRLVRVVRLLKYITPGGGSGISMPAMAAVTTRTLLLFNALFSLAVLVNLMGCIWWVVAINGGLEDSWAAAVSAAKNIDLVNGSDVDRWITSIYFALTTVTTIGYGDVTPMTITEIGVTIVFEIIGVAFFGYIINTATAILAASGPSARRAQAIRGKLEDTEEVMRAMEVPNFLKRKIRAYYSEQWAPPVEGPRDARFQLYLELPPRLRTRLVQEKQERPLKQLGFLPDGLTPRERKQVLHILATASVPVRLVAGQRLEEAVPEVPANSPDLDLHGPCIHILDEGEMRALRPGAHFDPSGCIGGRVDFSGPAVIGLTVLFSPDVAPSTAGGGGGADRHKSGSKRQMAAAAAAAVAAAGTNSGDMHRHRRHNGSSSSSGASSSSSGSSSGDSSGDDGSSVRADRRLSHNWQRSVVALSECHLWRINCPQLSTQLRTKQPRVLLHLLDKLLLSLGIDAAAESGGSWVSADTCTDEAQAPGPLASPAQQQQPKLRQQATFRTGTASRLLRLRADLLAEVAAAKESLGGGVEGGLGEAPPGASGRSVATAAWWGRPSLELSQVSVEPGAGASRGHSAGGGGSINAGSVRAEV